MEVAIELLREIEWCRGACPVCGGDTTYETEEHRGAVKVHHRDPCWLHDAINNEEPRVIATGVIQDLESFAQALREAIGGLNAAVDKVDCVADYKTEIQELTKERDEAERKIALACKLLSVAKSANQEQDHNDRVDERIDNFVKLLQDCRAVLEVYPPPQMPPAAQKIAEVGDILMRIEDALKAIQTKTP